MDWVHTKNKDLYKETLLYNKLLHNFIFNLNAEEADFVDCECLLNIDIINQGWHEVVVKVVPILTAPALYSPWLVIS